MRFLMALAVLVLTGCGSDSPPGSAQPGESPGEFMERLAGYSTKGQHGRAWDILHPADQAIVSREKFAECRREAFEDVAAEITSFKAIETYADPIDVTEIPEKTSQAVTYRVTVKTALGEQTFTDTGHAVQVGDHWVWVLKPEDYRSYKAGTCPA